MEKGPGAHRSKQASGMEVRRHECEVSEKAVVGVRRELTAEGWPWRKPGHENRASNIEGERNPKERRSEEMGRKAF